MSNEYVLVSCMRYKKWNQIIWNKGTAFEATLHNNCVDEVYLQPKGDMMNVKT